MKHLILFLFLISNSMAYIPTGGYIGYSNPVSTGSGLPVIGNTDGDVRVALDTKGLYSYDQFSGNWLLIASPAAATAMTALTGDVHATGPGASVSTIQPNVVTNSKLAQMSATTLKGNNSGSLANASDLTVAQVNTMLGDVLNVTGTAPIVSSGGSSPAISCSVASGSQAGCISSTDWNTFNNKQSTLSFSSPLVNSSGTVSISNFVGDSGSGGSAGAVPSPSAASAAEGMFLGAGGNFSQPGVDKGTYNALQLISQTSGPSGTLKYQGVSICGTHAYVSAGNSTPAALVIYNIKDQLNPVQEGYISLAGAYNNFCTTIAGTPYVFVALSGSSPGKISAVNVSNPMSPTVTSTFTMTGTPGAAYGVVYLNGYVYIASQSAGLNVADFGGGACGGTLSVPVNCFQEGGGVKSFGIALGTVSGTTYVFTTQYVTSVYATRQLKSWSISTPQTPSLLQNLTLTTVGQVLGLSVSNNGAYVSVSNGATNKIDIVDVTNTSSMSDVSQVSATSSFNSNNVAMANGNYLYVPSGTNATYGNTIDMFDVSSKSSPVKIFTGYSNVANAVMGGIGIDPRGYLFVADYGVAPGSSSTLDVYTIPKSNQSVGTETISQAIIQNIIQLPVQASGVTPSCSASFKGDVALTNSYIMCVCNSSSWVKVSDGSTSCTF